MAKVSKAVAQVARVKLQVIDGGRDAVTTVNARSIFDRLRCGARPYRLAKELGICVADLCSMLIEEAQARESKSYQRGWSDRGRMALYPMRAA